MCEETRYVVLVLTGRARRDKEGKDRGCLLLQIIPRNTESFTI